MSDSSPASPDSGPPTPSERRTVSRPAGFSIALVTAAVVFGGGSALWPVREPAPAPVPAELVAGAPPLPPPPASGGATDGAASGAMSPDAAATDPASSNLTITAGEPSPDAATAATSDAAAAPVIATSDALEERAPRARHSERPGKSGKPGKGELKRRRERAASAARTAADGGGADPRGDSRNDTPPGTSAENAVPSAAAAAAAPAAPAEPGKSGGTGANAVDCALPEKDMAREAWRRNRPAVCPLASTGKAFVLIPLKGSLEGESHALYRRPVREARIVLPAGSASLLTMKQYKVRRLGFKDLRVSTTEGGGMRLRVTLLPGAGDPVFEIKDGYAKITVATPDKS